MTDTLKSKLKIPLRIFIILSLVLILLLIITFPWSALILYHTFSPNPPKPEITYGEFPFELVYEIDGETITVNDTYICKFDGFGSNEGTGKYREWKGYVKSTGKSTLFITKDDKYKFYCNVGKAEYYMGDTEHHMWVEIAGPTLYADDHDPWALPDIDEEERRIEKIKIISWKFSEPIENSFE